MFHAGASDGANPTINDPSLRRSRTASKADKSLMEALKPSQASAAGQMSYQGPSETDDYQSKDPFRYEHGLHVDNIKRNLPAAKLYEDALKYEKGTYLTSAGALATRSGDKTGRVPQDKRIVTENQTAGDVWWGPVNIPLCERSFHMNRERAVDYLNTRDQLYVFDGFAGWDPRHRVKIRVICARAYHALFMSNMLIRPTAEELENFGKPHYVIYNAGQFPANRLTSGMTSASSVALNLAQGEMVILGTQYAGEMKKGVFTIMHYLMPKRGVLSLHSSANEGPAGDVTLFFGLSGTGKTTLSADPARKLIGDDEHCWSDDGVFNIEGGCYAKCANLSAENEPDIFNAVRFGAVMENVVMDDDSREVDYADTSITENTRVAYPIEHIANAKLPCMGGHPTNIIMLTCDAFGVLPPVAKLTKAQAMYHFISGYTSKMAGTEQGVKQPTATFSACFGEPFLVWHPVKYAQMLAEKMEQHNTHVYLVNTGWTGGAYGEGKRISIKASRAIIDAIHSGELLKAEYEVMPVFELKIPRHVEGVDARLLNPAKNWRDVSKYTGKLLHLAHLFEDNFREYASQATTEILGAGPFIGSPSPSPLIRTFAKEEEHVVVKTATAPQ